MKKILVIPKEHTGIVDIRKTDYLTLENVTFLEQISKSLVENGKQFSNYKFCQFEPDDDIPVVCKVIDKIGSSSLLEFTVEKVTFKESDIDDCNDLIEKRYLEPIKIERQSILTKVLDLLVFEKVGVEVKQIEYDSLKEDFEKIEKKIKDFRHVQYMKKKI